MKNKDYLFAVAAIRANELSLLKESDLEQLINAPDYKKAVSMLAEKGYDLPEGNNYSKMLDNELEKTWQKINESAPEADALKTFIVKNDFQNLKAILKSEMTKNDAKQFFVSPCIYDAEKMLESISERKFEELPELIADTAKKAYDTIVKTGNGQLCDIIIDAAALEAILSFASESNDDTLIEYAQQFCLLTNVKTAYRSVKTNKNQTFLEMAVAENSLVDKKQFIEEALKGENELFEFLGQKGYSKLKEAFEKGTSSFEKYCDDESIRIMKKAKMTVFGISPLAGYYVARETEIKCLRIILSAKLSGVSNDVIRERMRELYV